MLSPVVFSDEPPPALKVNAPSFMSTVPDASMQSLPLVMFSVPPEIYTYPFSVSSVFSLWIPSVPDVTVILPPAILTLSLPERPCDAEVILYVPPVILRSSFVTMPCLLSHFTFRVPLPLKVYPILRISHRQHLLHHLMKQIHPCLKACSLFPLPLL